MNSAPSCTPTTPGLDVDAFDEHCDHLIIREERTGEVVGTYRMLPPDRAVAAGGLYADTEFDLAGLRQLRGRLVETGRSCVHPDHRSGAVINLMWAGIARYMHLHGHRWLGRLRVGAAADGGATAAGVWDLAQRKHLVPPAWRVRPRNPLALTAAVPAAVEVRRCSRGTCGWVPGSAANRRTTRTSTAPTSSCCCRWTGSTRGTCGTSSARGDPVTVIDSLWLPRSTCDVSCLPARSDGHVPATTMLKRVVVTGSVLLLAALAVPVLALLPQRGLIAAQRRLARARPRRARHLRTGPSAGSRSTARCWSPTTSRGSTWS